MIVPVDLGFLLGGLFQNTMEIAAAESEGTDSGTAGMFRARQPRPAFGIHIHRCLARLDQFQRPFDFDRRRQNLVVERHCRLDQSGDSGGGFGVTDHRFDRAERTPSAVRLVRPIDFGQRFSLDRITDLGAGTVRFHQFNGARGDIGLTIGGQQAADLSVSARGIDGVAFAIAG